MQTKNRAVLLFSSPERVDLIARLTSFFAEGSTQIIRFVEYSVDQHFFARLVWQKDDRWDNQASFEADFQPVADQYSADFRVNFFQQPVRLGVFVASQTHTLLHALTQVESNQIGNVEISFVIGTDLELQSIADRHGLPFFHVSPDDGLLLEKRQLEIVQRYKPDLIGLANYDIALSAQFLNKLHCPAINVHQSTLAKGGVNSSPMSAYESGAKLLGATSRFVTPDLDQGPIIEQDVVRVRSGSTEQALRVYAREIEQKVFCGALAKVIEHKAIVHKNRTIIFD